VSELAREILDELRPLKVKASEKRLVGHIDMIVTTAALCAGLDKLPSEVEQKRIAAKLAPAVRRLMNVLNEMTPEMRHVFFKTDVWGGPDRQKDDPVLRLTPLLSRMLQEADKKLIRARAPLPNFHMAKWHAAHFAYELFEKLSDKRPTTYEGGAYRKVTSLLYRRISTRPGRADLKRACDSYLRNRRAELEPIATSAETAGYKKAPSAKPVHRQLKIAGT